MGVEARMTSRCAVWFLLTVAATAGCDATISESLYVTDAAPIAVDAVITFPDAAVEIDAAPDAAPPCVEGDDRETDMATGTCYFVVFGLATHADAAATCAAAGATLAEISSDAEQLLVASLAGRNVDALLDPPRTDFWLGGTDLVVEGTWAWPSGTDFWTGGPKGETGMAVNNAYENWRTVEPNNSINRDPTGENCMNLEADTATATWDDRPCGDLYGFVCER